MAKWRSIQNRHHILAERRSQLSCECVIVVNYSFARFYEDVRPGMLLELSYPRRSHVAPTRVNLKIAS